MLSMEYPMGGPWLIGPEGGREGGRWRIADKDNWFIAVITNTAKAHLISAAPEMLAKLEEVRDMMLDQFGESEGVHQLNVIIAKATGETIPVYDGPGPALVFDSPSAFIEVKLAPEPQCRTVGTRSCNTGLIIPAGRSPACASASLCRNRSGPVMAAARNVDPRTASPLARFITAGSVASEVSPTEKVNLGYQKKNLSSRSTTIPKATNTRSCEPCHIQIPIPCK